MHPLSAIAERALRSESLTCEGQVDAPKGTPMTTEILEEGSVVYWDSIFGDHDCVKLARLIEMIWKTLEAR